MEEDKIKIMIEKYSVGEASAEEIDQLVMWLESFDTNPSLTSSLSSQELNRVSNKMLSAINNALDASLNNSNCN